MILALSHDYFQGPTIGLECVDLSTTSLLTDTDVLMCTHGVPYSQIPAAINKSVVLRALGGNSASNEPPNECVTVAMGDALRLNIYAVAAQIYIGSEYGHQSINNIIGLVDAGNHHGMPILAATGVDKEVTRDARYFSLANRAAAEMGA